MPAEERALAPDPRPNVLSLGLPGVPRDRQNEGFADLRNLPERVVALRDPGPSWEDRIKASLTPEMEAINALIDALDHRTRSGKRSRRKVRDLVYDQLERHRFKPGRAKVMRAIETLVTMKWWERGQ